MAGRKKSVSVQEELLLCPSAKPGDWFPGIPVSAVAGIDEAGRGCLAGPVVAAAGIFPVISAASIIAKTFRDMLMDKLDHRYPGYGFAKHKGYGSKEHFAALRELGPCPMHRKTFRGVLPEQQTARQGSLL